jgi:thiol-disulfide isomerase/thioredoxin
MSTVLAATMATVAALGGASVIGVAVNRRSGVVRETGVQPEHDSADLGLSDIGPTVVHFSAAWCGPCASVRRVVDQICEDLPGVAHMEIDIDTNPVAAKRFSVLSLPTTLIFDAGGRQRYRSAGVPKAADLRTALEPLLA